MRRGRIFWPVGREISHVGQELLLVASGEIALNTQIEQTKAAGKTYALLPQKAIRSEKAEILSMKESPGMYIYIYIC